MLFNDLLEWNGFLPEQVLLVRHTPREALLTPLLRNALITEPALFETFQATQALHFASWLRGIEYLSSFLEDGSGRAIFVGIYKLQGSARIGREEWLSNPLNRRLISAGMEGWDEDTASTETLKLGLVTDDRLLDLRGRLLVEWKTRGRSWTHRADRHEMKVLAIHETSSFDPPAPPWDEWVLTWEQLRTLPSRQRNRLAEWRGTYMIFDATDGLRYVGSASGSDNLLGRWLGYADRGDGGNVLLKSRDPQNFRFSILQRVSPDMPRDEVLAVEATWKRRLNTRHPFGLNAN